MSIPEDVELRDLLAQTLESNGTLAKIRAKLRASVYLALDEDELVQKKQPLINNKIKKALESNEGKLMFCIVREFLEFFNLDYTISVYESESYSGESYTYEGRNKLLDTLNLERNETVPVLLQLIKLAQETKVQSVITNGNKSINEEVQIINKTYEVNNITKEEEKVAASPRSVDDTYEGTSSIAEDSIKEDDTKASLNDTSQTIREKKGGKSSLTSLSDLPPLQIQKNRNNDLLPSLYSNNFKDKNHEIDKLFNSDSLDNYEEDFMSGSEIDVKSDKSEFHQKISRTDCNESVVSDEFELNSNIDDILKSNASN